MLRVSSNRIGLPVSAPKCRPQSSQTTPPVPSQLRGPRSVHGQHRNDNSIGVADVGPPGLDTAVVST
jgi:hypothetical protein